MTRIELEQALATAVQARQLGIEVTARHKLYAALSVLERMTRSKLEADTRRRIDGSLSSRVRVFAERQGFWAASKLGKLQLRQEMREKFNATPQQISNCLKRIEHAELGR